MIATELIILAIIYLLIGIVCGLVELSAPGGYDNSWKETGIVVIAWPFYFRR
jgi:hypothetical protein